MWEDNTGKGVKGNMTVGNGTFSAVSDHIPVNSACERGVGLARS